MKVSQERITPEKAQEYLMFNTENYRSISKDRVISYANDMVNGKWQFNGEAIEFDENGKLIDGQHRLHAIVRAGVPVDMLVIRGVKEDVNIYDIGSRRSMGQIAKARGIVPGWYTAVMACAAWIVGNGDANHNYSGRATVLQYAEEHTDDITRAVRACTTGASTCICKRSAIISAAYCMIRDGVSASDIGDFMRIANTGLPHGHNNPSSALVFRNMVQEHNSHNPEEKKLLFSAAISGVKDFMAGKERQMRYKFNADAYNLMYKIRLADGLTRNEDGMKIENLEITEIAPYENAMWTGIKICWSANIGFGECDLYKSRGSEQWCADTEKMCDNQDKDFLKMLFDKLVDIVEVTG